MIRPGCAIAFCAGLALAWCGTAEAQTLQEYAPPCLSHTYHGTGKGTIECVPQDAAKVELDDLKERVRWIEQVIYGLLQECSGDPPEHLPCIEREAK